jgi:hypothetical protein
MLSEEPGHISFYFLKILRHTSEVVGERLFDFRDSTRVENQIGPWLF